MRSRHATVRLLAWRWHYRTRYARITVSVTALPDASAAVAPRRAKPVPPGRVTRHRSPSLATGAGCQGAPSSNEYSTNGRRTGGRGVAPSWWTADTKPVTPAAGAELWPSSGRCHRMSSSGNAFRSRDTAAWNVHSALVRTASGHPGSVLAASLLSVYRPGPAGTSNTPRPGTSLRPISLPSRESTVVPTFVPSTMVNVDGSALPNIGTSNVSLSPCRYAHGRGFPVCSSGRGRASSGPNGAQYRHIACRSPAFVRTGDVIS